MAESGSSGQEKTEEPTAKKLLDARQEGQVPRSRELTTLISLLVAGISMLLLGEALIDDLKQILRMHFVFDREFIFNSEGLATHITTAIESALIAVLPLFVVLTIVALLAPAALGGWAFSAKAFQFKPEKLDPIKGSKKILSWNGIVELLKALAKFVLVSTIGYFLLLQKFPEFAALSNIPVQQAIAILGSELIWIFLILSSTLILVSVIDVPFQMWNFNKQQRMTKQEIKDENKESDGNPEMKGKVKSMQREIAQRRMMEDVPTADVVITNPTHFAVALRYDQINNSAPIVVAIGKDLIALQIRRIASANEVPVLEAPVLARSLYYHSDLGKEIPAGLYLAVAQVLAYIYQLKQYQAGGGERPNPLTDIPVPDDLREDDRE
ncbi:MAG: flagellar biosynthesis protein FlhB [Thiohalomonadales bacterium]